MLFVVCLERFQTRNLTRIVALFKISPDEVHLAVCCILAPPYLARLSDTAGGELCGARMESWGASQKLVFFEIAVPKPQVLLYRYIMSVLVLSNCCTAAAVRVLDTTFSGTPTLTLMSYCFSFFFPKLSNMSSSAGSEILSDEVDSSIPLVVIQ